MAAVGGTLLLGEKVTRITHEGKRVTGVETASGKVIKAEMVASNGDLAAQIHGWAPIARKPLPFPALLVGSRNDPYCSLERAEGLAQAWGARFIDYGERGHVNAESGLGDWDEGHGWLMQLANPA